MASRGRSSAWCVQHDREEHRDEHVVVGVLGRLLALLEPRVTQLLELVRFDRVSEHVLLLVHRSGERVRIVEWVVEYPRLERGTELVAEASFVERGELVVALGLDLEPAVEVEEVLVAFLRREGGRPVGEAARGARGSAHGGSGSPRLVVGSGSRLRVALGDTGGVSLRSWFSSARSSPVRPSASPRSTRSFLTQLPNVFAPTSQSRAT